MDTIADIIASEFIEREKDPAVRKKLEQLMDIYENAGYLPSLTDWEMMSEEEQQDIIEAYM